MASDVSGNDQFEEVEEVGKAVAEEVEKKSDEISESESFTAASIDYSPMFKDLQNEVRFNSVIILAFLLLFGLLKGLKIL